MVFLTLFAHLLAIFSAPEAFIPSVIFVMLTFELSLLSFRSILLLLWSFPRSVHSFDLSSDSLSDSDISFHLCSIPIFVSIFTHSTSRSYLCFRSCRFFDLFLSLIIFRPSFDLHLSSEISEIPSRTGFCLCHYRSILSFSVSARICWSETSLPEISISNDRFCRYNFRVSVLFPWIHNMFPFCFRLLFPLSDFCFLDMQKFISHFRAWMCFRSLWLSSIHFMISISHSLPGLFYS